MIIKNMFSKPIDRDIKGVSRHGVVADARQQSCNALSASPVLPFLNKFHFNRYSYLRV